MVEKKKKVTRRKAKKKARKHSTGELKVAPKRLSTGNALHLVRQERRIIQEDVARAYGASKGRIKMGRSCLVLDSIHDLEMLEMAKANEIKYTITETVWKQIYPNM